MYLHHNNKSALDLTTPIASCGTRILLNRTCCIMSVLFCLFSQMIFLKMLMRVQFLTHLYKDYRKKSEQDIVFNSNCNLYILSNIVYNGCGNSRQVFATPIHHLLLYDAFFWEMVGLSLCVPTG